METPEKLVYSIIGNVLHRDPGSLRSDDRLENLVDDSVQFFELIAEFKKQFNREILYADVVHIETIADIIEALSHPNS